MVENMARMSPRSCCSTGCCTSRIVSEPWVMAAGHRGRAVAARAAPEGGADGPVGWISPPRGGASGLAGGSGPVSRELVRNEAKEPEVVVDSLSCGLVWEYTRAAVCC